MTASRASVVIRAKDEAESIGRTLELLAGQTAAGESEVIVVDSGSSDDTVAIARAAGVRVIEIPAESFTFGGSLNTGAAAAEGQIVVALSAHAFPLDDGWLERMIGAFDDPRVACACGDDRGPDGALLAGRFVQDEASARAHPRWGYSNAAGGFRAQLWRERPFRADMPGTEDKEWAWHWLLRGRVVAIGPDLLVDHDHSHDDLPSVYMRNRREWLGFSMYIDAPRYGMASALREWWTDLGGHETHARARLSPWRITKLAGKYTGLRAGRRAPGGSASQDGGAEPRAAADQ